MPEKGIDSSLSIVIITASKDTTKMGIYVVDRLEKNSVVPIVLFMLIAFFMNQN